MQLDVRNMVFLLGFRAHRSREPSDITGGFRCWVVRRNLDKESREISLFGVSVSMHWDSFSFALHYTVFKYEVDPNKSQNLFLNV